MYKIIVDNTYSKIKPALPDSVSSALSYDLSYKVKGAFFSPKYRAGHWDGKIHLFNKRSQAFGTGLYSRVVKLLNFHNVLFDTEDIRNKPEQLEPYNFNQILREYQNEVVTEMLKVGRGIIKVATGGGKSYLIGKFISQVNVPTLIIVPKKILLNQFHKDLSEWLNTEIGWIGEGICNPKRITVATVKSLSDAYSEESDNLEYEGRKSTIKQVVENVQSIIIDECHHLKAETFQFLSAKANNSYYRFGFSATPFFSEELSMLVEKFTGRMLVDINASKLIGMGYLAKPTICLYEFKHTKDDTGREYMDLYDHFVVHNSERNNLICELASEEISNGKSVLIAVNRIEHGNNLYAILASKYGDKVVFIDGTCLSDEMMKALDKLNTKKYMCVIATTVFGEGINVKTLDVLINTKAHASQVDTLQLTGRVLRKTETKSTVKVIDIFDRNCKYLVTHANDRLKAYETEPGFEIIKIK